MTTPNAIDVIRAVSEELGDRVLMGVGTVLDDVTARLAILAGAEYVVTPVMRPDVIGLCRRYSKPVVCGGYTPRGRWRPTRRGPTSSSSSPRTRSGRRTSRLKAPCRSSRSSPPAA